MQGIVAIGVGTNDANFAAQGDVTATPGGGQAQGFRLTNVLNRINTCATAGDSVVLPKAVNGLVRYVTNAGAAALDIFPETGDTIRGFSANIAQRIAANTGAFFTCATDGTWHPWAHPLPVTKQVSNATSGATTAAAGDLTGAQNVFLTLSAVGAANFTTRTAAQMYADLTNIKPGDTYFVRISNTSGGTTTLVGGTGVTITGTATIASGAAADFSVAVTSSSAITFTRVGTGSV